jgi:hypothetical protein
MQGINKPIFIVGFGAEFVTDTQTPGAVNAFGTKRDAEDYARKVAHEHGHTPEAYRVARYDFTGDVAEVKRA